VSVDLTPHALYDIDNAAEYLEAEKDGGGGRFREDLGRALTDLEQFPEAAELFDPPSPRHPGLRFTRLRKFRRYAVYYRPVPGGILVVRVLHVARDADAVFGPDPPEPPDTT
jgi:toxin ParE1/3/4